MGQWCDTERWAGWGVGVRNTKGMTQHKMKERQERMKGWEKDREQGDPDSKPPCIYKGDTVGHRQQARRLQRKVYISSFGFSTISLRLSTPCCMSSRLFSACSRAVSTSSVTPYTSPTSFARSFIPLSHLSCLSLCLNWLSKSSISLFFFIPMLWSRYISSALLRPITKSIF